MVETKIRSTDDTIFIPTDKCVDYLLELMGITRKYSRGYRVAPNPDPPPDLAERDKEITVLNKKYGAIKK